MRNEDSCSSSRRNEPENRAGGLTLLLVGATGLVGQAVLRCALNDGRVARLIAPTRRPLVPPGIDPGQSRFVNPLVDFDHLPPDAPWWWVDAVVCTLGTTLATAGSREAFRRVDHDYVLDVARLARAHHAQAFALTSAAGADSRSRIFYNRTKGEVEASVAACGYPSFTVVRPGLIGGERQESRPAEFAAKQLVGLLGPLLPRRFRLNPPGRIARALLEAAVRGEPGRHLITSDALTDASERPLGRHPDACE